MGDYSEHEKRYKLLNKQFSRLFLLRWLLFFIYNIVADVVIYCIRNIITSPIAVVAVIVSTGLSFYITLKSVVELKNIKNEQENRIRQETPMGKFKL